jgi:hypothetical protein
MGVSYKKLFHLMIEKDIPMLNYNAEPDFPAIY